MRRRCRFVGADTTGASGGEENWDLLDLGNYDLVAALRKVGCPLCRVLAEADARAMDTFVDAGAQLAEATKVFRERGGFCREHAWLFHQRAALALTGVPVAAMYRALLRQDIARIEHVRLELAGETRGRRSTPNLFDRTLCPACERAAARLEGKAHGLIAALQESDLQRMYRQSDGLCVQHMDVVGGVALATDRSVARFLITDIQGRLQQIEERLLSYDRTRDYRFATERTDDDTNAWTDVVRLYVGDQYSLDDAG